MTPSTEVLELEPIQSNGNGLPRAPTLEAQRATQQPTRDWKRWRLWREFSFSLFSDDEVPDDLAERILKSEISKSEGDTRKDLEVLLSDYTRFKDRPGLSVVSSIVLSWIFQKRETADDGTIGNQISKLQLEQTATFSEVVTAIAGHLSTACPNGLRLWVFSFEPTAKKEKGFFSASHKGIATLRGRLRDLPCAPNNIVAFLIAQYLNIPTPTLSLAKTATVDDGRRKLLQPPSDKILWGNLDPSQLEDNHIVLKWQSNAPKFTSDIDVYIWEQYKALPICRHAEIKLWPESSTGEARMLILLQDVAPLKLFCNFRTNESIYPPSTASSAQSWSTTSEALFSICAILQVIVSDSTTFLQQCSIELENMNLLARQDPTTNKIRHLVHLEDYRASAQEGIVHVCRVIERIKKWIDTQHPAQPFWDAGQSFQSRFSVIEKDLIFLRDQLIDISQELKELQQTLREHLELTHNRRNFILTIIAAVYLPLSFATSFFGMNINTKTPAGPQGFSNWTASWIANSPVDIQNSTRALASTIGSSGTETYAWKTFIITSVCLVITLPISLTFGTIFRALFRSTTYYATYWRALAVVPLFGIFFISTFGELIGTADFIFQLFVLCLKAALSLFLLFKFIQQDCRSRRSRFWTVMAAVWGSCFGLDSWVPYFPFLIIPWGLFWFFRILPWWKGRRGQHNT